MPFPCLQRRQDNKYKDEEVKIIKELSCKVAETELRENDVIREQCLLQFKEWIKQNKDIENCIIDDNFLLRFLRAKKFSLPMAQQMLLKYLNFRRIFKYICYNLDCLDRNVNELIDKGFIFVSPNRDAQGRRVIISIPQKIDPYKFTSRDIARVAIITIETLLADEENQVLGFVYVGDAKGIGPAHIAMWNITEFATIVKWAEVNSCSPFSFHMLNANNSQQSFPARHKALNFINLPNALKYVLDFAKSRLSPKLAERVTVHISEAELHEAIDPKILPKEYGGELSMREMIEEWKCELSEKRNRLLSLDSMNLLSDSGIIRRRTKIAGDILGLQGSFRKLELD